MCSVVVGRSCSIGWGRWLGFYSNNIMIRGLVMSRVRLLTGLGILGVACEGAQARLNLFLDDWLGWLGHGHSSLHRHSGLSDLHRLSYRQTRYKLSHMVCILTWASIAVSLAGIEALHVVVELLLTGLLEPDL